MTTLTKEALVDSLHETLRGNKREAKELVEMFFEEVTVALSSNVRSKLSGFGNFDLRDKSERPGRNPKTGEEVAVSARRVVTFKPGQKLRQQVDKYASADSE